MEHFWKDTKLGVEPPILALSIKDRFSVAAIQKIILSLCCSIGTLMFIATSAYAQITESDIDYEPGSNETIQRITSTFEVRRAVIGLLIIAAVAGILFFFYWYKTGQWARERHAQRIEENSRLNSQIKKRTRKQGSPKQWDFISRNQGKSTKPFRRR
tara:strand:- start:784 stop:1254 length:471 start_codon:yes stop_codon:yes gene_type:complete